MYKKVERTLRDLGISFSTDVNTLKKYATDESIFSVMPHMLVTPYNTEEVQKIVRTVALYTKEYPNISLTVRAAGTGLSGGSLNDSIILDITNMTRVGEIEKNENGATLRVAPGVYFKDIQALLETEQLYFPPYPSSWRLCTIGGMVANNAAGPNSLKYGHTSEFIKSLEVVMYDGVVHTFEKINHEQLQQELSRNDSVGELYTYVWNLLQNKTKEVADMKPHSSKNSAGYELWDVLQADSVEDFKKGNGYVNMIHVFCGSQGTIGIVTNIVIRVINMPEKSDLLIVPIYEVNSMGSTIQTLLEHNPYNIELYDDITYKLALKNPSFFKQFFADGKENMTWIGFVMRMYGFFVTQFHGSVPKFTIMVKFDGDTKEETRKQIKETYEHLIARGITKTRIVKDDNQEDVFWRIRGSSYTLAKLTKQANRPAAFLEDIVVPPEEISEFIMSVQEILAQHHLQYAVHGHGGNGHFHFYPLFDFTDSKTPERIFSIAREFYTLAVKHKGNICGEHNDGIMRTPFLRTVFTDSQLEIFKKLEHTADPDDIFNPGKKVNPKFDIKGSIRTIN